MWVRNRYTGPGGGLYTGPDYKPYICNWPPRDYLLQALKRMGREDIIRYMLQHGF